ncbi:prosaposin-like [Sinocyclocheilus rhinocerous]|uniref:prosaposin-like n=1 Tax=Sinocyclocheilus rhinocerous TaxID=307959 RepID=UPI0007BA4C73|nr:PREDICTED: prosaposin-like [Sinocyclocheilus rhinocerous]
MQFACITFFLFTSTLTLGWARSVDLQLTEPQTPSLSMMNMCTDCKKIVQLLTEILSNQDSQHLIEKALDKFCYEHPVIPLCMDGAKTYVHVIIRHFSAFANQNGDICTVLRLCGSQSKRKAPSELTVGLNEHGLLYAKPSRGTSQESALNVSDCESCKILAVLSRFHLGHNATEIQTSDLLQKMCHLHPNAIPRCEGFVKLHGHRLLKSDGKQPALTACEEDYLCKGPK